jgi:hypothetical protein
MIKSLAVQNKAERLGLDLHPSRQYLEIVFSVARK